MQRLWLRLGVNVDNQLCLRLNLNPMPNRNPSPNLTLFLKLTPALILTDAIIK